MSPGNGSIQQVLKPWVWAVLILVAAPAGRAVAGPPQNKPRVHEQSLTGKVMVVRGLSGGGEPQITDAKGKRWMLMGPLQTELLRVHGHTLTVRGAPTGKKAILPGFTAASYEILDAGGQKPVVGRLRREGKGRYVLVRKRDTLRIRARKSMLRKLKKRVGCKVWLAGTVQGKTLKPFMYGWLTCKPPKVIKPKKENTK